MEHRDTGVEWFQRDRTQREVGSAAAASACWYNMANRDDIFVAHPWLKGLPQGHVVAYPYTVNLTALYPG
jgi:hypothetical protein